VFSLGHQGVGEFPVEPVFVAVEAEVMGVVLVVTLTNDGRLAVFFTMIAIQLVLLFGLLSGDHGLGPFQLQSPGRFSLRFFLFIFLL